MTTAKDCFADNIKRLDHRVDPIQHNLNLGLALLCERVELIERQQQALATMLQAVQQTLQRS